jgi:hypothetical protein
MHSFSNPAVVYKARRFKPQYTVRGRKRFPIRIPQSALPTRGDYTANSFQSSQQSQPSSQHRSQQNYNNHGKYDQQRGIYDSPRPADKRFDMPNIFTQSGFEYEQEKRPIINRPPPRHPGVRVPGVQVPPNAGNIEDIIAPKPVQSDVHRYTTKNSYRPSIVEQHNNFKPIGNNVPPSLPPIN